MSSHKLKSSSGRRWATISNSFVTSLAEAVSVGGIERRLPPIETDPNKSFQRDWKKLGGDMRRATATVTSGAKK